MAKRPRGSRPVPPLCPVTGVPAKRLVQWVSADLLADLWRHALHVDVRPSFRGTTRFGLWESSTGLHFFDPPRAGDAAFYEAAYGRMKLDRYHALGLKAEFLLAARRVRDGERVLDVGCGYGAFRHAAPNADYVGLDPYQSTAEPRDWRRAETLAVHLATHEGVYDVACAFQVLEHVEDPAAMVADMVRAVRPGGRVIIGVPHVPSASSRIPNYLINAVPHHVTWWTEEALMAIAVRAGLTDARVEVAPWSDADAVVYWIDKCSPVTCRGRYYRHAWSWHASVVFAYYAARIMARLKGAPRDARDEGASLLLIAEKPAVSASAG